MCESFSAYFNGKWMPADECKVSISDRGFTLGDGVFEIERTFNTPAKVERSSYGQQMADFNS